MKCIIFDFDGTIADSMPLVVDIARGLLPNVNLSDASIAHLRNLPPKQIIKASKLSYVKIPRMLVRGKRILSKRLDEIPIADSLDKTISRLHDQDYKLYVVSSNSETNIRLFLDKYHIKHYFRAIYGNVGLFSKAQTLKKVIRWQKLSPDECLYVGDEVRDIEAAKKVGIKVAAVTWGFSGKKILKSYNPDFLVNNPDELIKIAGAESKAA